MKERKRLVQWIKAHKKELIIAGVSIAAVVGVVLLIRNRKALKAYWSYLLGLIPKSETASTVSETSVKAAEVVAKSAEACKKAARTDNVIPFEVAKHIRNLPDGWHASPGKIATALENGVTLHEGQTWVDTYWKGVAA